MAKSEKAISRQRAFQHGLADELGMSPKDVHLVDSYNYLGPLDSKGVNWDFIPQREWSAVKWAPTGPQPTSLIADVESAQAPASAPKRSGGCGFSPRPDGQPNAWPLVSLALAFWIWRRHQRQRVRPSRS